MAYVLHATPEEDSLVSPKPATFVSTEALIKLDRKRSAKQSAHYSREETHFIEGIVQRAKGPISPDKVNQIARRLDRPARSVKDAIQKAREKFALRAERYVDIHLDAVESALQSGTDDALEVAMKGSQWAIEHIRSEGSGVIETLDKNDSGMKIMIGIKLGGMREQSIDSDSSE